MDPNSGFLLKIKLVGNKKKGRQDLSCYSFTKVVDADTTNGIRLIHSLCLDEKKGLMRASFDFLSAKMANEKTLQKEMI